ncbi:MAG: glycoside hydrolase [Proteobacteria bacterium]|jgi:photosystem II stability/assembly factor-like uncharacterized protein|nr:glycoside hydrolase [Pseudomonadota bacterium]
MKRAALVLSILTLAAPVAHASWTMQQCNGDQNTTYLSIGAGSTSVAAAMGYINSGSSTQVLYSHTADGDSWVEGGFALYGSAVGFADASVGYMGGLIGKVWRTIDGGASWAEIPEAALGAGTMMDGDAAVDVVVSDDGATVWIVGAAGRCSHSEDGGTTWTKIDVTLPAGEELAVTGGAIRGETIWLVGGLLMTAPTEATDTEEATPGNPASSGFVLRSDDGGTSFETIASDLDYSLDGVSFVNPEEGWAAAAKYTEDGGAIGITSDGGETWDFVAPPDLPDDEVVGLAMGASKVIAGCGDVRFFGRLVGVASCTTRTYEYDGSNGLYLSTDGGETWAVQTGYKAAFPNQFAAASAILDAAMPDCNRVWLTGEGKVIARWDNDDTSLDCEEGGAPSDEAPADDDAAGSGGGGCGCAAAGATSEPAPSLFALFF